MIAAGTTLYVHVPFCVVKCGYCDFNSYADHDPSSHDQFLTALERELDLVAPKEPPTVFIGGGTPTFLDEDRFGRFLEILCKHVDLAACEEVTVEANPESLTLAKAERARAAGVNRFSVGAQSFDPQRLGFLDRAHDAEATRSGFENLRQAGFENVSVDMMFGLPGQAADEWRADLESALELRPDHVSCYNLTFEPGTKLTHDRDQGRVEPNDPEVDLEIFDYTRETLRREGFVAYEISNFAGRGGPCRHNDHYWLQGNYHGVGPGAASHHDGTRATNLKVVRSWAKALENDQLPHGEVEHLSDPQRAGEAVWLGLRRADGIDLEQIRERTGIAIEEQFARPLSAFEQSGHLARSGSRITLTERGIRLADTVSAAFLELPSS